MISKQYSDVINDDNQSGADELNRQSGVGSNPPITHVEEEILCLFQKCSKFEEECMKMCVIHPKICEECLDHLTNLKYRFEVQSLDQVGRVELSTTDDISETPNVDFLDQTKGTHLTFDHILDDTILADAQPGIDLQEFLARPVLIKTISWLESDTVGVKTGFNPWHLFFNNTPIKKKLDNYAFLTCNLRVKFVINASPFYYGSYRFAYNPLESWRTSLLVSDGGFGEFIPLSQRPGVWILPQVSQGGEITLPFFYHKNWLDATSAAELQSMGTISPVLYQILRSANGAVGTGVTIQIYAWAEDIKLFGSTSKLAVQSQDEYGIGPISKPASAVATAMGMLSGLPVIGRYMRASSMVASTVGQVAHLFGFTNVPNINNVDAIKIQPHPHLASPEISTPVEKLTLDPKNELTIDPRTVGLPAVDELTIKYLSQKESYLTACLIATSDVVDANVFSSLVKPKLHYTNNSIYQTTPMCYLQQMFKYWRGDIIFRFRFICTKFHKGRVRITYDPTGDIIANADNYSTTFNQVVDIGSENDVEITVPYSQALSWLKTDADLSVMSWNITGSAITRDSTKDNGYITMRVVTPLSAPTATSTVSVQIFVRAGENFEVALPDKITYFTPFAPQSVDQVSFVEPTRIIAGNSAGHQAPDRYMINMGENIVSARQVLRRACKSVSVQNAGSTADFSDTIHLHTKYPLFYGYDPSGVHLGRNVANTAFVPFNYVNMTHYNWLSMLFIGQRGSMIWNINTEGNGAQPAGSTSVRRYGDTITTADYLKKVDITGAPNMSTVANYNINEDTLGGVSLTNQRNQTGLSVLYPDYNQFRFRFTSPYYAAIGSNNDGSNIDTFELRNKWRPINITNSATMVSHKYVSIGPDFNFYFFLCTPSLYYYTAPSTV